MPALTRQLVERLKQRFALDWTGIHGVSHWARVRLNGLRLAAETGADPRVVELFAFLHDSCRLNDGHDPEHGLRAARFAREINTSLLHLDDRRLSLLVTACRDHTSGTTHDDMTVLSCWDADRLDLGRVGIRPHPARLCTGPARASRMIEWAFERSQRGVPGMGR